MNQGAGDHGSSSRPQTGTIEKKRLMQELQHYMIFFIIEN
jgi:hypothetical protein